MLVFVPRRDQSGPVALSLASAAFQPAPGQYNRCNDHLIQPEPEFRSGLSLARNSALATITRSTFPTCAFTPYRRFKRIRSISRSLTPFGFEADSGRDLRRKPVFRVCLRHSRSMGGIHSPLGLVDPPDQSVRPLYYGKLVSRNIRFNSFVPLDSSFR
jgi:hypothetical protein